MIEIKTLNGSISLSERKLVFVNGVYKSYLFISIQTDREFADMKMNREQVEELIRKLAESLLWK